VAGRPAGFSCVLRGRRRSFGAGRSGWGPASGLNVTAACLGASAAAGGAAGTGGAGCGLAMMMVARPGKFAMAGRFGDLGGLGGGTGDRAGVFAAGTGPGLPRGFACAPADRLDAFPCAGDDRSGGLAGAGAGGFVARPPVNRTEGFATVLGGGGASGALAGRGGGAALWGCGKPPERAG